MVGRSTYTTARSRSRRRWCGCTLVGTSCPSPRCRPDGANRAWYWIASTNRYQHVTNMEHITRRALGAILSEFLNCKKRFNASRMQSSVALRMPSLTYPVEVSSMFSLSLSLSLSTVASYAHTAQKTGERLAFILNFPRSNLAKSRAHDFTPHLKRFLNFSLSSSAWAFFAILHSRMPVWSAFVQGVATGKTKQIRKTASWVRGPVKKIQTTR